MKIDLVYTWLDGSDPLWQKRRAPYLPADQSDKQVFCKGRIIDNDELRYSLRSVEMYAPWINHIFIVTDRQIPNWIDLTNKKVTIIDQNDILPPEVLPTFNSVAIEQCLHKIDGLSEYFLYANDDMMFGRKVSPDFFFNAKGQPISRVKQRVIPPIGTYEITIINANKRINSDFGLECIEWDPHHQIDAYSKSSIACCLEHYSEWSKQTLKSRFRSEDDMQRHIFTLWGAATKTSEVLVQSYKIPFIRRPLIISFLLCPKLIFIYLRLIKGLDSLFVFLCYKHILDKIKLLRPALVCFNDSDFTTDEQRVDLKYYLDTLYPNPSSFEKHE